MMYWVQISAGQGPAECSRAVWHISRIFIRECEDLGIDIETVSFEEDREKKTFKSVLLKAEASTLKSHWEGTVCWQSPSPFRANHKRKNWFVKVSFFEVPDNIEFNEREITFEAVKGGGPGGQHVNKTSTGVRAVYLPLKLSVCCHEERSQLMNKKLALMRLKKLVDSANSESQNEAISQNRMEHYRLERGNAVRIFNRPL